MGYVDRECMKHHHSNFDDCVSKQVDLPLISINGEKLDELGFTCWYKEKVHDICDFLACEGMEEYTVECYLSNKWGQPLSVHNAIKSGALLCKEMEQAMGRRDAHVRLPSGKTEVLQAVKVLIKGYVGISILDATGRMICRTSKGIHFATVETLYLSVSHCSHLFCSISHFACDGVLLCKNSMQSEFQQLDLSISLCLDVRVIEHHCSCHHCHPRSELEVLGVCHGRKFPHGCPQIFPASD